MGMAAERLSGQVSLFAEHQRLAGPGVLAGGSMKQQVAC